MKNRTALATALAVTVVTLVAWTAFAADDSSDAPSEGMRTSIFHVTGMTCSGCEVGVRRVVGKLDGVEDVEASHDDGTATVTYETGKVTPEAIIAAIEELGYTAELADSDEEDA